MKYIGHFMRMNILTKENIKNQLFFFSKESLQNIVINSGCGVTLPKNKSKSKHHLLNDINIFDAFSPLLCVYKKANCKLIDLEGCYIWNEKKFKKEINVSGNALMTLGLLELVDYYKCFKDIDEKKYAKSNYFLFLCEKQLDFYVTNFRNEDGVFQDKNDTSDELTNEIKFTDKKKKFDFGNQALIMAAFYKYSQLSSLKNKEVYKDFSLDILNMLFEYKDEVYNTSPSKLIKLMLSLQIFYHYSKNPAVLTFIIDLSDLVEEKSTEEKLSTNCLMAINYYLFYNNFKLINFKEKADKIIHKLITLYEPVSGIFLKDNEKKELSYDSDEIVLFLVALILNSELSEENKEKDIDTIIIDIYKHLVVNSGIIPSWPDAPSLEDSERYIDFTKSEGNLLDDYNFRMENIPTPENIEIAPVYLKSVVYNRKKASFNETKPSMDSTKNMLIHFIIIALFKKSKINSASSVL